MPEDAPDIEGYPFALAGAPALARPAGALWFPEVGALAVADLHLGKAERMARRAGALLPPYDTAETLDRLAAEIAALDPATVICLGDSFDDAAAADALDAEARERLAALAAGRRWVWVAGNHDPGPVGLAGAHVAVHREGALTFRHIAAEGAAAEISGHYHPKATLVLRGRRLRRRCFLVDGARAILPAFGAYTGGLDATDPVFDPLLRRDARALLLGARVTAAPRAALAARA